MEYPTKKMEPKKDPILQSIEFKVNTSLLDKIKKEREQHDRALKELTASFIDVINDELNFAFNNQKSQSSIRVSDFVENRTDGLSYQALQLAVQAFVNKGYSVTQVGHSFDWLRFDFNFI